MRKLLLTLFMAASLPAVALEEGDTAKNIPLSLLEGQAGGQTVGVDDFKGQLVYLDFWASWCGPCRQSLPILNEIRAKYNDKGFEVVAVNVDENLKDALGFLERYPVSYPILLDPKGEMPKAYDVKGMPTAYLLDKNGKIIYKHVGFKKKDRAKIVELIEKNI